MGADDSKGLIAQIVGDEDATDTTMVAKSGREAVRDGGTTLGVAASGVLVNVDIDEARQRLRDVQTALVGLCCYGADTEPAGQIDGVWGPMTRDAIAVFQEDHGMEATGQIDGETYEAILNAYEEGLSTEAALPVQDDVSPLHAEHALGQDATTVTGASLGEIADDTTVRLLELQDEADLETPEDLENLQEAQRFT